MSSKMELRVDFLVNFWITTGCPFKIEKNAITSLDDVVLMRLRTLSGGVGGSGAGSVLEKRIMMTFSNLLIELSSFRKIDMKIKNCQWGNF